MARKSVFTFGKYENRTVQQCIDLKNLRALRWYYYNCSMISFLPDILDEIGITEEWRIEKPGKNPDKGEELNRIKDENTAIFRRNAYENGKVEELGKINKVKKRMAKRREFEYNNAIFEDERNFTKGRMQAKNHGRL